MFSGKFENEKEKRTVLFFYTDFRQEVAEVDIVEDFTEDDIRKLLAVAFPALKADHMWVKGVYEGSPSGVFKALDRVRWMLVPPMTEFHLDVVAGEEAHAMRKERKKRKIMEEEAANYRIQVLRQRWAEGHRKCARCKQMFYVQSNSDKACKFVEMGFSAEEGHYRRTRIGKHVQAGPRLPEYNDHVRDITLIGSSYQRSVKLGTVGIGLVEHAKSGVKGAGGEDVDGWTIEDFLELPGSKPAEPRSEDDPSLQKQVESDGWCSVM